MKLVLIRRTETNKDAGLTGEPVFPSPAGYQQIEKLVGICRENRVEAVIHSTATRAIFTAEALALALNVPILEKVGIEERNFGDWNAWGWPQIKVELDKLPNEERYTFIPPNGESWQQMDERLVAALRDIAAEPYSAVAVVSHYGPIRALLPIIKNEPKESTLDLAVTLGESFVVEYANS
jgi:broad specificity phosphatase PhoE